LLYLRTGRFDNARTHFEVALQLDPLSALTQLAMVRYFYFTEQYDAALEQIEQVLELDPDHVMTHVEWLPLIHAARGDRAAVLQAIKRGENIGDYRENVSKRMMTAAMAGERALARSYIEKSRQHVREHPEDLRLFWYSAGVTEAHLGNLDAAYAYLERTLEAPNYLVPRLLYSPLFAPVRADPRFEAFRASMGMPAPNTESARSLNRPS
jgi:tetratricopeptide (TPR) repeat protein